MGKKLETFKSKMKLAKSWLKTHWYIFPIALVGIFSLVFIFAKGGTMPSLLQDLVDKYRRQIDRHNQEVAAIEEIRVEQVKKQKKIDALYNQTVKRVEEDFAGQVAKIDDIRSGDLRRIIERTQDDPDKMVREVNIFFGVPVFRAPTTPPPTEAPEKEEDPNVH